MKDVFGEQLYDPACLCTKCAEMRAASRRVHPAAPGSLPFADEVCVVCGRDKEPTLGDWCRACEREGAGL